MPPTDRPLPRFLAEPPHELQPHGRWHETLAGQFLIACEAIESDDELGTATEITWFPERTYAGRVYVPATAETDQGYELFGYVSFTRSGSEPGDFDASADYTDETAGRNPDWKLDLSDEVIGRWHGPGSAAGDVTLVWGAPLVAGGVVATAELGGDATDQCALVQSDRFTLVSIDAVQGLGDALYLEVKLWNRGGELLATESLYEA